MPDDVLARSVLVFHFFFQAEDGIRDRNVTGVQTCALPIYGYARNFLFPRGLAAVADAGALNVARTKVEAKAHHEAEARAAAQAQIGRASCRERGKITVGDGDESR